MLVENDGGMAAVVPNGMAVYLKLRKSKGRGRNGFSRKIDTQSTNLLHC
jgi:hypothetical protein